MPSDTAQIVATLSSLAGMIFTGVLTYFMQRLKADEQARSEAQRLHAETTAGKVDEIQQALARIEHNRANLESLKTTLQDHGTTLVAHARDTAAKMITAKDHDDLRGVLEHYVTTTQATIDKLAAIDNGKDG